MANLSVRNIDDGLVERLRIKAARNGVSMEEEVRRIIRKAVSAPQDLAQLALECFGPVHGIELDLDARAPHEPIDLEK